MMVVIENIHTIIKSLAFVGGSQRVPPAHNYAGTGGVFCGGEPVIVQ